MYNIKPFTLKNLFFVSCSLSIVLLDYITKIWIKNNFVMYETKKIFSFLNIFYTKNYGIAFGFFSKQNNFQKWILFSITFAIIVYFLLKIYFISVNSICNNIAYSLILGGALGNFLDRLYHGFVIDFIDFQINSWHFATFNIADFFIFSGTLMSILLELFKQKFT